MKKILISLWIVGILVVGIVYAAPDDLILTFRIPAAEVKEFRTGFLYGTKKPRGKRIVDANGIPIVDANGVPTGEREPQMTDKQHVRFLILKYMDSKRENGLRRKAADEIFIKSGVIE